MQRAGDFTPPSSIKITQLIKRMAAVLTLARGDKRLHEAQKGGNNTVK